MGFREAGARVVFVIGVESEAVLSLMWSRVRFFFVTVNF